MKTPEGKPKDQIRKWLKEQSVYHYWPVSFGYGRSTVDVLMCVRGYFIACEVKRPGTDGPTGQQKKRMKEIKLAGGQAFWADSLSDFQHKIHVAVYNATVEKH